MFFADSSDDTLCIDKRTKAQRQTSTTNGKSSIWAVGMLFT